MWRWHPKLTTDLKPEPCNPKLTLDLGAFDPCRDTIVLIWLLWTLTGIPLFAISYLWPIILEKQFQIDAEDQYWRMIIFVVVEVILIPKPTSPWLLTLCAGMPEGSHSGRHLRGKLPPNPILGII